ncbi:MAG: SelT/SelW/SelH family protein [Verrucomicrobia bacterium]|nr:SelT/SelW/SelH family protein [Verrucomicrobiota bacterium]
MLSELKFDIKSLTLVPGKGGIFEVLVDGKKVYSKIETGQFPEPDQVLKLIRAKL